MGVPAVFDPLVHHIGLGADTSNLFGFLTVGQYSKALANPVFSKPSDIGTADLIGNRALSWWTQDDYSGGEFQEDWSDPAMFAECVCMLPDQLTRRLRTIRPLDGFYLNDGWPAGAAPIGLDHIDGYLFLVFNTATPTGKVYCVDPSNPASSPQKETVSNTYLTAGNIITATAWNTNTNRLWIGQNAGGNVLQFDYDRGAGAGSRLVHYSSMNVPSNVSRVTGIHIFGTMKFIVTENQGGVKSLNEDGSEIFLWVSGGTPNTKWDHVGAIPGTYVTSVTYNNAIYILSRSGNQQTFLSMTQGSQVFPVLELPYFFRGYSMVEYAGRLYIAGVGYDLEGGNQHGELYEVSGASLRLVRTFAANVNAATPGTQASNFNAAGTGLQPRRRNFTLSRTQAFCVAEGLLWMPDAEFTGLEAYDATTDAFFGGPRFRSGNDTDINFTNAIPYGDAIYLWASATTGAKTGFYRTERRSDGGELYRPHFVTSTFQPEPARPKIWSRFTAITIGTVTPKLYYSTDHGYSWTLIGTGTTTASGDRKETVYDLAAFPVPTSRSIRFKLEWQLTGAASEAACYLVAHSLSFLVKGDTKRRFSMTLLGVDTVEDISQNTQQQVPVDISTKLWALKDLDAPLAFRDIDRVDYKVVITDISESCSVVDATAERFVVVTLLEV